MYIICTLCTPCIHFARHIHSLHSLDVEKIGILTLSGVKYDGYVDMLSRRGLDSRALEFVKEVRHVRSKKIQDQQPATERSSEL